MSLLSCSFYNQGCNGGYPYLVGKWSTQFGVTSETCEGDYRDSDDDILCSLSHQPLGHPLPSSGPQAHMLAVSVAQSVSASPSCAPEQRIFAKDYGYVGGCFEYVECTITNACVQMQYPDCADGRNLSLGPRCCCNRRMLAFFVYSSNIARLPRRSCHTATGYLMTCHCCTIALVRSQRAR
eukprot:Gregarina_sp_Poly_1__3260@NODE_1930_length_3056_cov_69_221144_g205_i1_p2_GENE_NODE_1930_length_3056_cov_69_221144_g205_i1NODE_1930_length_3056_cov_69_221144_g205_i1_p2_ORF_typecomplete_len181_score1_50Peptidase_C1/PF00112_23/4e06_NODE_1930_length_3056_cov_69_221144_g205_i120152557